MNNFVFTTAAGFPEGASITTEDSLLLGFGLEAVTGAANARGGHGPRDGLLPEQPVTGAFSEFHEGGASAPPSPFRTV